MPTKTADPSNSTASADAVMDAIQQRFGKEALYPASLKSGFVKVPARVSRHLHFTPRLPGSANFGVAAGG